MNAVARGLTPLCILVALSTSDLSAQTSAVTDWWGGTPEKKEADNSMCYVCHLSLETEKLTVIHKKEGHGCTACHGRSTDHMHDEMLMTTPDKLYGRLQVGRMCGTCHEDQHEKVKDKVAAFRKEWEGKERPNGRAITENSICTDCHGTHNIDKSKKADADTTPAEWAPLFNGKDLCGWKTDGEAAWTTKLGRIVATPGGRDEEVLGGDLFTEKQFKDYLLAVTFKAKGPIHGGVWLRATAEAKGPRVEILKKNEHPVAYTGSITLADKGLALINLDNGQYDDGGWNTLSIEVRGPRVAVWLNGGEIGAVRCGGAEQGRIGLHLGGGKKHKGSELSVREVILQELPEEEKKPDEE